MGEMTGLLDQVGRAIGNNPALAFPLALLGGLASAFSPCVLASVPLVVAYVGGYADDRKRCVRYTLLFCLGLVLTFTALGALAAILGRLMSGFGKWWYLVLGGLALFVAFWLLGVFGSPAASCRLPRLRAGAWGALGLGALAGVIASPCATPPLAAILAYVAGRAKIIYGVALLAVYAVGHCLLIFLAGTSMGFVQRMVDSSRMAQLGKLLKAVFGALTLLLAVYLLYMGM